jgi:hypothetical protein
MLMRLSIQRLTRQLIVGLLRRLTQYGKAIGLSTQRMSVDAFGLKIDTLIGLCKELLNEETT